MAEKKNEKQTELKLTPQEYFDQVKERKQKVTDEMLDRVYENCLTLLNKYKITGQKVGIKKILFHLDCLEKEREIVKLGVDTFVYKDAIEDYIDHVADDAVKIIELENYERDIPNEIVSVVEKVKDKFDRLYVVFTDYTGKKERQIKKDKQAKDPILFGAFLNDSNRVIVDRFYYLGDWVDEYCDLTLDKMVNEYKAAKGSDITRAISTPQDIEELKQQLDSLKPSGNLFIVSNEPPKKKSFFAKIKSIFSKNEK